MYVELERLKELFPDKSDQELIRTEQLARTVIDIECGQSFEKETATYLVGGEGSTSLRLPKRLISATRIRSNGSVLSNASFVLTGDGWILGYPGLSYLWSVKADDGSFYSTTGPIIAPTTQRSKFPTYVNFEIEGVWGYDPLPTAIVLATELLVEDFLCGDFEYRNKHVKVVRTADWQMEFFEAGGTGNMVVDKLLSEYKITTMVAI